MSTPEDWYKGLPVITRYYFTAGALTTVLTSLGMLSPMWIILDFDQVFGKFQIWRLITNFFFFGRFGMQFMFQMYILVKYFGHLENGYYSGPRGTAELLFMVVFGSTLLTIISYFYGGLPVLGSSLVFMALYVWSRKDPYQTVMLWSFQLQAWHFPFVVMVLGILMGGSPIMDILGIIVGHLYHFLTDVVPRVYGVTLLKTPEFLYGMFERGSIRQPAANWQRGQGYRMAQE